MDLDITAASAPGLLTLLALPGTGPHRAERLAAQFHTLREVRAASATHTATHVPIRAAAALAVDSAWTRAFQHTHMILHQAHDYSVRVRAPLDTEYPAWLRDIRQGRNRQRLTRTRLVPFVKPGRTIRKYAEGHPGVTGLPDDERSGGGYQQRAAVIARRAYGFRSAGAVPPLPPLI